jgi:hypothetical protein
MSRSPDAAGSPVLTIVLGICVIVLLAILIRAALQPDKHSVYPIFANAAREWNDGVDLYDRTLPREDLDKYRYAPIIAASFSPFAVFPDALGGVLWRLVNGGIYLAGLVVFLGTVFPGPARLDAKALALVACVLLALSVGSLNNAQPNSLIAGCFLLAAAAVLRQRWNLAGVCLGVPVLFKVYPLALVLLFLLIHPVRLGWRTALMILAGLALPFVLQDPRYVAQVYQSWFMQVANDNRRDFPLEYSYRDLHTLTRAVGLPIDDGSYAVLQVATAVLVACVVLCGHWQAWPPAQHLRVALDLGCCWMLLLGPATENSTYTLLAPTLALALWESLQRGQPIWKRFAMMGILSLFTAALLASVTPFGPFWSSFLMPLGALLLFAERLAWVGRWTGRLPPQTVQAPPLAQAA